MNAKHDDDRRDNNQLIDAPPCWGHASWWWLGGGCRGGKNSSPPGTWSVVVGMVYVFFYFGQNKPWSGLVSRYKDKDTWWPSRHSGWNCLSTENPAPGQWTHLVIHTLIQYQIQYQIHNTRRISSKYENRETEKDFRYKFNIETVGLCSKQRHWLTFEIWVIPF